MNIDKCQAVAIPEQTSLLLKQTTFPSVRNALSNYLIQDIINIIIDYVADFRFISINIHEDPKNKPLYNSKICKVVSSECELLLNVLRLIRMKLLKDGYHDDTINQNILSVVMLKNDPSLERFAIVERMAYWAIAPYAAKLLEELPLLNKDKPPRSWKFITHNGVIIIRKAEVFRIIQEKIANDGALTTEESEKLKKGCESVFINLVKRSFDDAIFFLHLIDIHVSENVHTYKRCILNKTTAIKTILPFCKDKYERNVLIIEACKAYCVDNSKNQMYTPNVDITTNESYRQVVELVSKGVDLQMTNAYGSTALGLAQKSGELTLMKFLNERKK